MKKTIAIACGGTGGHIHPALAVAALLRSGGHDLSLILSGTRAAERPAGRAWEGPLLKSGARPIKNPLNLMAFLRCRAFLRRQRPDVLFATGGYTCVPPVLAARSLGIPVVLHEANSLAGQAVRFLSKHFNIAAVATSFEGTAAQLPWAHAIHTGLPLRQNVLAALERARRVRRPEGSFTVFVTGGSQGAHGMNLLVAPVLASLARSDRHVRIVHQCGEADLADIRACYAQTPKQAEVLPFVEDMGAAYGRADLVIARAGAATCFELARCAVPAILIPLPTAADDHQRRNAEALVKCGGALCLDQRSTTPAQLAEAIRQIYSDPLLRKIMREALADLPHPDATRAVAELVLACSTGRPRQKG